MTCRPTPNAFADPNTLSPGAYRWEIEVQAVGNYLAYVTDTHASTVVHTDGPEGHLVLPGLSQVEVEVELHPTRALRAYPLLDWRIDGETEWTTESLDDGFSAFQTTPGWIELQLRGPTSTSPGYCPRARTRLEVVPGLTTVTMTDPGPTVAFLALHDPESHVPWNPSWTLSVRRLDGPGGIENYAFTAGGRAQIDLTGPGTYRLDLPALPGFHPVLPMDFEIEAGIRTELSVPLRPVR